MKITNEELRTTRQIVEKERKRLINEPNTPGFKSWLGEREYPLDWMKEQFGKTLIEKEGFIKYGRRVDDNDCNVCGREVKPDEIVIHFDFSFCEEYDCGMNICKKCIKRIAKKMGVKP